MQRLQLLLDSVPHHAIHLLDDAGQVSTWSAAAERITGFAAEEIVGQPFERLFTPEDRRDGAPSRLLKQARECGRVEVEGWRRRKDGSRFWAQSSVAAIEPAEDRDGGYAMVTRDLTEQRAARESLAESERRIRLMVEGVVDYAIFLLDPSGIVTNWNAGAERIKGYRADEIVGRHFSLFYSQEERSAGLPAQNLRRALEQGRHGAEGWRLRKDGTRFWANVVIDPIRGDDGELIGFAKVTRDITDQRAAQVALEESERRFRLLVRGVSDYALYMLDPNGVITNWNSGAETIKGYTADEIVGQHYSKFYTEADRRAGVPARALATAAENGKYEAEGWRVRKDGSLFWAQVMLDAIRDDDGQLIGFAKITRDITERRDAQLRLQKTQEQLAQAQKMEALGQLTGGVAHDFNNLLMIVSGHTQILKRQIGDSKSLLRSLEAIEAAAQRGESLTRRLLSFARRQRLEPAPVDLHERTAALRQMLSNALRGDIDLIIDAPAETWPVMADLGELDLALLNLAVNARDAMPGAGVLTISAENVSLTHGEVEDLQGDFVAVTVSDTGVGMPPDIIERVFDPFFTTKQVNKGTGLGLSHVYGFAHQSGGAVTLSSEVGKGSRFTLYLPRAGALQPARAQADPAAETTPGGRILLVEDNPDVARVSAEILEQLGYQVRTTADAEAALGAVAEEDFDLVFSDIVMAGALDGLDLARRLRDAAPGVPVLLATGYSKAAESARDEFPILRKPYQMTELGQAVSRLISQAALQDGPSNLVRLKEVRRARTRGADQA